MKKRKINKSKIKRNIKAIILLLTTIISILYIIYITIISLYNYLYNRPIRTAVLLCVFGMLLMVYDTIEENKRKRRERNA